MKKFRIITNYGTVYEIDEHGCFLRYDDVHCNNDNHFDCPHESWKCTGIAEIVSFGRLKFYSLEYFFEMIKNKTSFTYKNGYPKFTLTDIDHGTKRIHGNIKYHGIKYAYEIKE